MPTKKHQIEITFLSHCEYSGDLLFYLNKTTATIDERDLEQSFMKTDIFLVKLDNNIFRLGYKLHVKNWCAGRNKNLRKEVSIQMRHLSAISDPDITN